MILDDDDDEDPRMDLPRADYEFSRSLIIQHKVNSLVWTNICESNIFDSTSTINDDWNVDNHTEDDDDDEYDDDDADDDDDDEEEEEEEDDVVDDDEDDGDDDDNDDSNDDLPI